MAWAIRHAATADPMTQLVLIVLADVAGDDGLLPPQFTPGIAEIARRCRCSRASALRAIARLRAGGLLDVGGGHGRRATYRIRLHTATGSSLRPVASSGATGSSGMHDRSHPATGTGSTQRPNPSSVSPSYPSARGARAVRTRYRSASPPTMDDAWRAECQTVCDGRCESSYQHSMFRDARLAAARTSS